MATFKIWYANNRIGLDRVIEADAYRMSGKFFEFVKDKEIVRTIKMDLVWEIRKLEEGEDDDEEDDLLALASKNLDESLADLMANDRTDEILAELLGAHGPLNPQ